MVGICVSDLQEKILKTLFDAGISPEEIDQIAPRLMVDPEYLKKELEFENAKNGIIGLETAFSLGLSLVKDKIMSLNDLIAKLTINPATIINLDRGILEPGKIADITIFDDKISRVVKKDEFYSKARNTPFDGWTVPGDIVYTIVGGKIIYNGKSEGNPISC